MYRRILFIGSKESGFKVFKKMHELSSDRLIGCVTMDDTEDERSVLDNFMEYCQKKQIPLQILTGKCDITSSIEGLNPDICFVMGWYYIIPDSVLKKVRGGILGIHNSLLPSYRGFAPVVWAMIHGEKEIGFSVFSMNDGMDTGKIWFQRKVFVSETDYISDVLTKIDEGINDFFDKSYLKILSGDLRPYEQGHENISYGARRMPEDGRIDWNRNAEEIYNFIRAQSRPYPGAYSYYRGNKVTIWKAEIFPYVIYGKPGQVGMIDAEEQKAVIVCGNNSGIVLHQVDKDKKEVKIIDLIKSLKYMFES